MLSRFRLMKIMSATPSAQWKQVHWHTLDACEVRRYRQTYVVRGLDETEGARGLTSKRESEAVMVAESTGRFLRRVLGLYLLLVGLALIIGAAVNSLGLD